jgi:ankyrin repeat protein
MHTKKHPNTSEAIRLAEASDWAGLQRLIEKAPEYAQECDDYGMLPIHWASTENNVPLCLLLLLLQAYPKGACIKNNANLLPLHIAIRARASAKWLSELVRVYPESINALTPNGQSILELAIQSSVSAEAIKVLQQARMKMAPEPEQDYEQEQQNHLQYHQQQQKQQHKTLIYHTQMVSL